MLILEGADCTGKTTLAVELGRQLAKCGKHTTYAHMGRQSPEFKWYRDTLGMIRRWHVQDRFHIGEYVYPRIRHETPMGKLEHRLIDAQVRLSGGLVVVLCADPALITERYKKESEAYSLHQVQAANTAYSMLPKYMDVDFVFHFDKTYPFPDKYVMDVIINEYITRQERTYAITRQAAGDA